MIRNPSVNARHELIFREHDGHPFADCTCGSWFGDSLNHDQLLEDYQVHRDNVDEAKRMRVQRLERAAARAMNLRTR